MSVCQIRQLCTGCASCYSICKENAIKMICSEEGFSYPVIDEQSCVQCGLCETVCPIMQAPSDKASSVELAYALRTKNKNIWKRSSSGGAFSEICFALSNSYDFVWGAVFDGLSVKHSKFKLCEDFSPICKSKYIESKIGNAYREIRSDLDEGFKTVFSGTPCQVSGLLNYLGKSYDNLFTIDFICHGVGSPDVFQNCIRMLEIAYGYSIIEYSFRAKRVFYETDHISFVRFNDGSEKYYVNTPYSQLYISKDCVRSCCGSNCTFYGQQRRSDITLADFKCLYSDYPRLRADRRNYSSVICHNERANTVIKQISSKLDIVPIPIEYIVKHNPLYKHFSNTIIQANEFFDEYVTDKFGTIRKWTSPMKEKRLTIKEYISKYSPVFIKLLYYKLVSR